MQGFIRRYRYARIAVLLLLGAAAIYAAQARRAAFQDRHGNLGKAPELIGDEWINAPRPITLASRRGKVTMVEFWTFGCSNCKANLPAYERWQRRYGPEGFTIVGIHTPELRFERVEQNVRDFVAKEGIAYPVLIDGRNENWDRWKQEYWPVIYLVDKQGFIREKWVGELGAAGEARVSGEVENLLKE